MLESCIGCARSNNSLRCVSNTTNACEQRIESKQDLSRPAKIVVVGTHSDGVTNEESDAIWKRLLPVMETSPDVVAHCAVSCRYTQVCVLCLWCKLMVLQYWGWI